MTNCVRLLSCRYSFLAEYHKDFLSRFLQRHFRDRKLPYVKKKKTKALIYKTSAFELVGGGAGIRTPDTANMSRMLYHLSYTAPKATS